MAWTTLDILAGGVFTVGVGGIERLYIIDDFNMA